MDVLADTTLNGVDESGFRILDGSELAHHGIVRGDVEVCDGSFILHGVMNGSLNVRENGTAEIRGIADLDSASGAGTIHVFGIVNFKSTRPPGFVFHPGCIVNGIEH